VQVTIWREAAEPGILVTAAVLQASPCANDIAALTFCPDSGIMGRSRSRYAHGIAPYAESEPHGLAALKDALPGRSVLIPGLCRHLASGRWPGTCGN
jgi:hypothetical protein